MGSFVIFRYEPRVRSVMSDGGRKFKRAYHFISIIKLAFIEHLNFLKIIIFNTLVPVAQWLACSAVKHEWVYSSLSFESSNSSKERTPCKSG